MSLFRVRQKICSECDEVLDHHALSCVRILISMCEMVERFMMAKLYTAASSSVCLVLVVHIYLYKARVNGLIY